MEECHEFYYQKFQACSCMYLDLFSSPDAMLDYSNQHRTYNLTNKTHESKLVQLSIVSQNSIYIHTPLSNQQQISIAFLWVVKHSCLITDIRSR
jgi:hypothetical protein